jgi:hypothetical protein
MPTTGECLPGERDQRGGLLLQRLTRLHRWICGLLLRLFRGMKQQLQRLQARLCPLRAAPFKRYLDSVCRLDVGVEGKRLCNHVLHGKGSRAILAQRHGVDAMQTGRPCRHGQSTGQILAVLVGRTAHVGIEFVHAATYLLKYGMAGVRWIRQT